MVLTGSAEPVAAPAPLKDWLVATKADWTALWSSPLAAAYSLPTDLPALLRLFSLRDDRERFHRGARKNPFVEGSTGQVRLNPLFAQVNSMDAEIRQLEDRFGLSAAARARLGIALGEAVRSLDDLNRELVDDDQADDDDPRLGPSA